MGTDRTLFSDSGTELDFRDMLDVPVVFSLVGFGFHSIYEFFCHTRWYLLLRFLRWWMPDGTSFSCGQSSMVSSSRRGNAPSSIITEFNSLNPARVSCLSF
ncbi:hypothetical protein CsSME_00034421 [Camellia sinensis var. sinensis]